MLETPEFDVVGIGNALVDVIAHADESFIADQELLKGSMTLIETERAVSLYRALGSAVVMSGGSAANTMCGIIPFDHCAESRVSSSTTARSTLSGASPTATKAASQLHMWG